MIFDDKKLKDILIKGSYLDKISLDRFEKAANSQQISLIDYLVNEDILNKDLVGQAIAESYKVAYADLNTNRPNKEKMEQVPENIAEKLRVVLYDFNDKENVFTTDDPLQKGLMTELKKISKGKKVSIAYSVSEDINFTFLYYKKPLVDRLSKLIKNEEDVAPKVIDEIFLDAFSLNASDIHFEPRKTDVLIRFRVDGVLLETAKIPIEYYENIINRIKVLARLRIDEHASAQDGSIRYSSDHNDFDLRASIIPTLNGEKIVLRVLASYIKGYSLSDIGMSENNQNIIQDTAKKPFGMIINTGPTGSGKTTTLYSILKLINNPRINITTIEDPVEYRVLGINQIQVNPMAGLTFPKGLRSIVRQDPDIILVGEIRDEETANIATNAALTGHLLLSTFHANDAATAIPRLIDMGVEPFLLASTLEIVIAQRLVRKICNNCKYSYEVTNKEIEKEYKNVKGFFKDKNTLYKGKGCDGCGGTGYDGRTAIFEIIKITPVMKDLILKHPSSNEIWDLAAMEGANRLFDDGILKIKQGDTTLEELMRIAPPPEHGKK